MKLSKFTSEELIVFDLKGKDKKSVIEELVELASKSKLVRDKDELMKDIFERENLVTTGVGYGVAFPHAKTKAVKGIVIAFGRSADGIDFEAMDRKPVNLFFLIAAIKIILVWNTLATPLSERPAKISSWLQTSAK